MSIESTRPVLWQKIRHVTDTGFLALPLPKVNPDAVSLGSVVAAVAFIVALSLGLAWIAWGILLAHLLLDGADGAIAKRYRFRRSKADRRHGQSVDLVADRASEFLLFLWPAFVWPWLPLALLNIGLAFLSVRYQRALVLPIRQAFVIVFTISLFQQ